MSLITDRRDLDFVLFDVLGVERILQHPRFGAYDRAAIGQFLDVAQRVAEDQFLPLAAEMDANEPKFVDGKVVMPLAARDALKAYADAGLCALSFPEEIGGLGAPRFLHTAAMGMFTCANTALANYVFVTVAAAHLLEAFGSAALKDAFLPRMLAGKWLGTMALSETQAGSSLADIRTTATARPDGLYEIKGSKMWISCGDHELSENIVHMVLAKIPGGPAGTKGISLFLVPKRRPDPDGAPRALNNITLVGLNHKMGQRGTTNCVLEFGDGGECLGHLIGEPHRGMEYMFHMMNEARIGVGHAAVTAALGGYLASLDYARTRTQGRPVGQKDPATPQVPIIEHADVKRMLLAQKAAVEGAQALCLYCSMLVDELAVAEDAQRRDDIAALLGLLTPVVKSWPSEHCLEANKWAIQILGGYGYTRDYPVERLYRDNRLNHIHEGTFGIQGIDLVGRKVFGDRGRTLFGLVELMRETVSSASGVASLEEDAESLSASLDLLVESTEVIIASGDAARRLANATTYLDAFGHVVIAWMWLRQAKVAASSPVTNGGSGLHQDFYDSKLRTCRYFTRYEVPLAQARLRFCASLDATCLDAPLETFG